MAANHTKASLPFTPHLRSARAAAIFIFYIRSSFLITSIILTYLLRNDDDDIRHVFFTVWVCASVIGEKFLKYQKTIKAKTMVQVFVGEHPHTSAAASRSREKTQNKQNKSDWRWSAAEWQRMHQGMAILKMVAKWQVVKPSTNIEPSRQWMETFELEQIHWLNVFLRLVERKVKKRNRNHAGLLFTTTHVFFQLFGVQRTMFYPNHLSLRFVCSYAIDHFL